MHLTVRHAGTGTAWLFPLVDGVPPLGWDLASRYLVLPVLLVLLQYLSSALISPPPDPNQEEGQKNVQVKCNLLKYVAVKHVSHKTCNMLLRWMSQLYECQASQAPMNTNQRSCFARDLLADASSCEHALWQQNAVEG